jgi:hypothetical protein
MSEKNNNATDGRAMKHRVLCQLANEIAGERHFVLARQQQNVPTSSTRCWKLVAHTDTLVVHRTGYRFYL